MSKSTLKKSSPETPETRHMKLPDRQNAIGDKLRRIETILLHVCDHVGPDSPEIAKIRKEIEEQNN